jgi:hypothetical protein
MLEGIKCLTVFESKKHIFHAWKMAQAIWNMHKLIISIQKYHTSNITINFG